MEGFRLNKPKPNKVSSSTKRRLYKEYKKVLDTNRELLKEKHNLEIDWVYRMWKIYTVPIEDRYNIYQYGQKYLNELVSKDLAEIDKTMLNLGLVEIVGIINFDIVDNFNVRIVISYKFYNLAKRMNVKIAFFSMLALAAITSLFFIF